jgi:hypothetical protein
MGDDAMSFYKKDLKKNLKAQSQDHYPFGKQQ